MRNKNIMVVWRADRTILNSVFDFPPDRLIITFPPKEDTGHKSIIATKSRMTIFDGKLTLLFDDDRVTVQQYGTPQWDELTIVYYLIYKTFVYYNCLTPLHAEDTEVVPEADKVIFQLHRYVKGYVEEDGRMGSYMDTEPCEMVLNKEDVADYLTILDQTIWLAMCYYLLGCDTQRYFLVEFYKCLEVIRDHFGNEKKMREALQPHGFLGPVYKETKKFANDRMKPLSIARHAPFKGVPVHNIDTKWLFNDPVGRKVFETGERACRSTIDAYIKFRRASLQE